MRDCKERKVKNKQLILIPYVRKELKMNENKKE